MKKEKNSMNRRTFIKTTTLGGASLHGIKISRAMKDALKTLARQRRK